MHHKIILGRGPSGSWYVTHYAPSADSVALGTLRQEGLSKAWVLRPPSAPAVTVRCASTIHDVHLWLERVYLDGWTPAQATSAVAEAPGRKRRAPRWADSPPGLSRDVTEGGQ